MQSLQGLGVVAQELSIDLGLLRQHLEMVTNLVLSSVALHLLLETLMEMIVELMQLRDLEEDHIKVFLGNDWLRGGQGHLHGLHVLETHTETLEVDCLRVSDAVEDMAVHQLSFCFTDTPLPTLVRLQ